ncbi:hypothetical protein [Lusitaniella coriacea]|uniref:hypothetical protein n=1 Tax=Lusitaniella coriacea TaxID=1983105 RepID=UPI003CF0E2F5
MFQFPIPKKYALLSATLVLSTFGTLHLGLSEVKAIPGVDKQHAVAIEGAVLNQQDDASTQSRRGQGRRI